jgi:predicted ATPase/class 3 adenylate cyclase
MEALTFLFTDLEGSTRTWEREPEAMDRWLASHDRIVAAAITANQGRVFKHTGDGLCAVFQSALKATRAAHDIQVGLTEARHERVGPLRARIALHTGAARERADDFYGPTLNRCARVLETGHGGQILLSASTAAVVRENAPATDALTLRDLGQHRLRDLQQAEHIWQLVGADLEREFPPLRSLDTFAHNLPLQRSSFIGREAETRTLRALLTDNRLVTVSGVGGCGKTRLALEVAAGEVEGFADGVFFADLSTLVEPSLVAATIAGLLRVPAGSTSGEDRLCEFLSDRHVLIVVDNCEHLLDACADVIDRLLSSCPRVAVLATSREPLALEGERVWRVPSLQLPGSDALDDVGRAESVRLFVDRAVASRPSFSLTSENAPAVAEICRRLDGIPLALELAAARVAHLAPREIASRLSERFRLLTTGRRGVQRQQTLQAVLDWSYELLGEAERTLLRRLSVFAAGWTLEAGQAVCAGEDLDRDTIVDLLGSLVSRSLVDAEDRGDHTRYRLLETVRMYAQDRLLAAGEANALRGRHATWFLDRAEKPTGEDEAVGQLGLWFGFSELSLIPDLDNLRQAGDWWLAQGRLDLVARIASAVANTFHTQGRVDEMEEWLKVVLAREEELPRGLRARCHAAWASCAEIRGDFQLANERARVGIAVADDPADAGAAYSFLVANLTWMAPDEAERLLENAAAWTRVLGSRAEYYMRITRGTLACARHDYDRAVRLFSSLDPPKIPGPSRGNLFVAHLLRGDIAQAAALHSQAVRADRGWFEYFAAYERALLAAVSGDPPSARRHLVDAVTLVRRWKIPLGLADCVVGCAVIAVHENDPQRASALLAVVRAATGGGLRSPMSMIIYRHYLRAVRGQLDSDSVLKARAVGGALTLEAALARELGVT